MKFDTVCFNEHRSFLLLCTVLPLTNCYHHPLHIPWGRRKKRWWWQEPTISANVSAVSRLCILLALITHPMSTCHLKYIDLGHHIGTRAVLEARSDPRCQRQVFRLEFVVDGGVQMHFVNILQAGGPFVALHLRGVASECVSA